MIETRPWFSTPQLGIYRQFHYDQATDEFHIETDYVDDQEFRNELMKENAGKKFGEHRTVASIPQTAAMRLMREGVFEDEKRLLRWLDTEGMAYRVFPGSLSR